MTRFTTVGLIGLALVGPLGCATSNTPQVSTDDGARLELMFAEGKIELVEGIPIKLPPNLVVDTSSPRVAGELTWQLLDSEGRVLAAGVTPDSRVFHYEGFGANQHPGMALAESGTLSIEVPDTGGTLRVTDAQGLLVASTNLAPLGGVKYSVFSPDGKADINFDTDVVGQPVLMLGDGAQANKFNILVLSEGYTEAELDTFRMDVDDLVEGIRSTPGFVEHVGQINLWAQAIKSKNSGISDPAAHRTLKTAFNVAFGDDKVSPRRCLMPSKKRRATSVGNMKHFSDQVEADVVILLANTTEWGGCASKRPSFIVQSRASGGDRVVVHELGHALFDLADEYSGDMPEGTACASGPNVSTSLTNLPWQDLITAGTPLPTPEAEEPGSLVGAFEGAGYCAAGAWRPQQTCLMRDTNAEPCQVCLREMERSFARRASAITAIDLKNETTFKLWVICDGVTGPRCSGSTAVEPGETAHLKLVDGAFKLYSSDAGKTVNWAGERFLPKSTSISIYENAVDPMSPPSPSVGTPDAGL